MITRIPYSNKALSFINCALATADNQHICINPKMLSCGHYICNNCFLDIPSYFGLYCTICNKSNTRLVLVRTKIELLNHVLYDNLDYAFNQTRENVVKALNENKDLIKSVDEKLDTHVEFYQGEIDLEIESRKIEFEQLARTREEEITELYDTRKMILRDRSVKEIDLDKFNKLNDDFDSTRNFELSNFYKYQNNLKNIEIEMKNHVDSLYKPEFVASSFLIHRDRMCSLKFDDSGVLDGYKIMRKLETAVEMERTFTLDDSGVHGVCDSCVIPPDKIIFLTLMTITFVNWKTKLIRREILFDNIAIAFDGNNTLYRSEGSNPRAIVKMTLELGELQRTTEEIIDPKGLCYYKNRVYVCDYEKKSLIIYDSDLRYQASVLFSYKPRFIKNINEIAAITTDEKATIFFLNLNDNNTIMKVFRGHSGIIGAYRHHFFEYVHPESMFYCYASNGTLVKRIKVREIKIGDLNSFSNNGSLSIINGDLLLTLCGKSNGILF